MSVMEFVLFSVTLKALSTLSVFSNFAQHSMKPTNRKKVSGFIYSLSL